MSIDIGAALSRGFDRTIQKNGLILVGLFFVVNAVQTVITESFLKQFVERLFTELSSEATGPDSQEALREAQSTVGDAFPLAYLDRPVGVLAGLWLLIAVVGIVVNIGAIRTFVGDQTDRLPVENFTRRLVWTLLNLIVGLVIYGIVVSIGFVLLVIPGIFFAVAFFFYNYEIIVNEKNVIEAFSASWALTSGNRLLLFVLGLIFFVLGLLVTQVIGFVLPGNTAASSIGTTLINTVITVFGIAVAAQAYNQLRQEDAGGVPDPTVGQGPGHGQGPQGGQPGQGPGQQGGQPGQQGGQPGQGPGQQGGQQRGGQPGQQGGGQRGGQQGQDRDDVY